MIFLKMLIAGIAVAILLIIGTIKPSSRKQNTKKTTEANQYNYDKETIRTEQEHQNKENTETKQQNNTKEEPETLDLQYAYKSKWLFTYNEKDAYWKLKGIAEKKGYIVFAKVRLLDLLEPRHGNKKYKTYFYKVQAKHVDFVLCDQKLVARIVVELDDSSHNREDRIERDNFVDSILRNTGYKVIRTMAITDNILDEI